MLLENKDSDTMELTWQEVSICLANKHGLHMRPAQKIVEISGEFASDIQVVKGDRTFSAKSILDMIEFAEYMVNATGEGDDEFVFRAKGSDAKKALARLYKLVEDRFDLD